MVILESNKYVEKVLSERRYPDYKELINCDEINISDYLWSKIRSKLVSEFLEEFSEVFKTNNLDEFLATVRDIDVSDIFAKIQKLRPNRYGHLFASISNTSYAEENNCLSVTSRKAWS